MMSENYIKKKNGILRIDIEGREVLVRMEQLNED